MLPKIKISSFLLKRLENVKQQCSGCVFGVFFGESTLLLMNFNIESTIGLLNYEQIQHKFPAELDLCGLVRFGDCSDADAHLSDILKNVDITDNPVQLQCQLGTLVGLRVSVFMHGKLQEVPVPYEIIDNNQLYRDFCFTRLICGLTLNTEHSIEALQQEMHQLRKTLADGSLVFNITNTKIFITNTGVQESSVKRISIDSVIDDLIEEIKLTIPQASESFQEIIKNKNNSFTFSEAYGAIGCEYNVINVGVLQCKTKEIINESCSVLSSPTFRIGDSKHKVSVPLEVEGMAILCKSTKLCRLYDILIESICRSLRLFEQSLCDKLECKDSGRLKVPRIYHFFPIEFGHFLSCSYFDGDTDDDSAMQEKRKRLHRHFGLTLSRPFFRRSNRCIFRDDKKSSKYAPVLLNTHIGLRPSGVKDGKSYIVQGNYYYYHYLQHQLQDKGWGCAYRSLQTIWSWFLLQGYTDCDIPTHREIQEYLYKIGDKPTSFVGSNQWIGSTELSMCLQGLLNVDCKILHISSGIELGTISSELITHFQTHGTPVMIGGGVLAHTIIGIDVCLQDGSIKYLVLDPHYIGPDELNIIQSKGWCGWKDLDFWDKKSYYNLCMPQRPIVF